jgi:hypothetical protein
MENKNRKKRLRMILFSLAFLVSLSFVSAEDLDRVVINIPENTNTSYIVNADTNNTGFWQGYTPTTLPHNILYGLQGGSLGEFYHLNQSVYNYLISNLFNFVLQSDLLNYFTKTEIQDQYYNKTDSDNKYTQNNTDVTFNKINAIDNITLENNQSMCLNSACSAFIQYNGTGVIIQS